MLAYPQIELDMEFSDHLVDIIEGGYDVVVRPDTLDSRLKARKLEHTGLKWSAPQSISSGGNPSTPEDLVTHACLHHRYPTSGKISAGRLRDRQPVSMSPYHDGGRPRWRLGCPGRAGRRITCVPDFRGPRQVADGSLAIVLGNI